MGELPITVTNESIFRIPVPAKISDITRDMASSDWLKLAAFCCLARKAWGKTAK